MSWDFSLRFYTIICCLFPCSPGDDLLLPCQFQVEKPRSQGPWMCQSEAGVWSESCALLQDIPGHRIIILILIEMFLSPVWGESLPFFQQYLTQIASCMNTEVLFPIFFHPSHCPKPLATQCGPVASGADDSGSGFVHVNTQHDTLEWRVVKKPALLCCSFTCSCESQAILENWRWWHCVDCWGHRLLHVPVSQDSRISWRCFSQDPVHKSELPGQGECWNRNISLWYREVCTF